MKNWEDLYHSNKIFYDAHRCRKHVIQNFLPTCKGRVLSVGTHDFNKNEHICVQEPEKYETIDLEEKYRIYGSPYKHTTIDFLDYEPDYKFDNIILYGVMGLPEIISLENNKDNVSKNDYTLTDNDIIFKKADALLNDNGQLFLGLDYRHNKTNQYWDNSINHFLTTDIGKKYTLKYNLNYWNKLILLNKQNII